MKHAMVFALVLLAAATGFAQSYIPHPDVYVTIDRSDYALGDVLEITLHNPTDGNLSFVGEPPFLIRFQDSGQVVFRSLSTVMHDVPAHSEPIYFYDTSDFNPGALSPGTYEVAFQWIDALDPLIAYEAAAVFELDTVISASGPGWGGIKAIFDR